MKKTLLISMLALLGMTQTVAQDYEYVPFVREGVKWVYYIRTIDFEGGAYDQADSGNGVVYHTLELKGDTVIGGKSYKAMHMYSGDAIDTENDTVPVYLREEDKIVYGIVPEGSKLYSECPVGNLYTTLSGYSNIMDSYHGQEFVLYDFRDFDAYINDLITGLEWYDINKIVTGTDSVIVGDHMALRHTLGESMEFIEGIGAVNDFCGYPLHPMLSTYSTGMVYDVTLLSHVEEDGEIIYKTKFYSDDRCYQPLLRDGLKWVNERVTVNHGDTTCHYYTYELNGDTFKYDNRVYKSINYCLTSGQNVESDSVIAGLREVTGWIYSANNYALKSVIEQDRNMISFNEEYDFGPFHVYGTDHLYLLDFSNAETDFIDNYYIYHQREPFLTNANYIRVDPVEIEGVTCSRFAYLGEDGEPLAYVVEGIGFDSRDLGDLLTPFTRKPDPDADYQEWCGLCHVVKDGKVIYKGMRYTPDNMTGIDEVVADKGQRAYDGTYYNLMGQPVGKEVPTTPGIYIHNGNKIIVR